MSRIAACAGLLWTLMCAAATPQQITRDETPPACADASTEAQFVDCVDGTEPGSGFHWLSLMHLGMLAMQRQDVGAAINYYDRARAGGDSALLTKPRLHAYRAAAYSQVGREEEALAEARLALSLLLRTREMPDAAYEMFADPPIFNEAAYAGVLPILHNAADPQYGAALEAYRAIPSSGWGSLAIRAATFEKIDELALALEFSQQAMRERPDHPLILNNHCYILVRLNRAAEGVPHCARAVELSPTSAATRRSYAAALAATGACERAREQEAEGRRRDAASDFPAVSCTPR